MVYNIKVQQFEKKRTYGLVISDPPWTIFSKNPTRGPCLDYEVMSLYKIYNDLERFLDSEVHFVWVTMN